VDHLGLLVNPNAKRIGRDEIRRLRERLGPGDSYVETRSADEVVEVLAELRARGVGTLAVGGGDGTLQAVATSLLRAGDHPQPRLLPLRGGTMNMVAADLGLAGRPWQILERYLRRRRERAIAAVPMPVLTLSSGLWERPRHGFFYGGGVLSRFLERYYRRPASFLNALDTAVTPIIAAPLPLSFSREFWRGQENELCIDGETRTSPTVFAAGTIRKLVLWFTPFAARDLAPGCFRVLASHRPPWYLAVHAWSLSRGRRIAEGDFNGEARELLVRSRAPFVLDGELVTVGSPYELRIVRGPALSFLFV
jgi:hypothetical protein